MTQRNGGNRASVVSLRPADGEDGGPPAGDDRASRNLGNWRKPAIRGALIVLLAFGGLGTWAATAPLDGAVLAQGEVTVESGRKVVEHLDGGHVREVLVDEGDPVKRGELLVRLNDREAQAAFDAARNRLDNALARRARLAAERNDLVRIAFPDTLQRRRDQKVVAEAIAGEEEQFRERRASLEGRISVQRQRIAQLEERIAGLQSERASVLRQTEIMGEELSGLREIMEKGYYPRIRVMQRERQLAQLDGRAGRLRAEIAQAREAMGETQAQIQQLRTQFREDVLRQLRETETQISEQRQQLVQAEARLDRRYVLAEFDGIVHDLRLESPGDVVRPGDSMLQIIPQNDSLVVEARISPSDIDLVRRGMTATVRLTALTQRTTPVLKGEVTRVSAERVQPQNAEQSYYTSRITISGDELRKLGEQELKTGMPAEVMIQTGERTLVEYIWKPISDAMSRGLIEP